MKRQANESDQGVVLVRFFKHTILNMEALGEEERQKGKTGLFHSPGLRVEKPTMRCIVYIYELKSLEGRS